MSLIFRPSPESMNSKADTELEGNSLKSAATEQTSAHPAAVIAPATEVPSCRNRKPTGTSFIEDVRSHIDEFLHASMDEHQSCLINALQKMFGISKVHGRQNAHAQEESILPLQVTTLKND